MYIERERDTHIYIYIYIYMCIKGPLGLGLLPRIVVWGGRLTAAAAPICYYDVIVQ